MREKKRMYNSTFSSRKHLAHSKSSGKLCTNGHEKLPGLLRFFPTAGVMVPQTTANVSPKHSASRPTLGQRAIKPEKLPILHSLTLNNAVTGRTQTGDGQNVRKHRHPSKSTNKCGQLCLPLY
jgi:hypothetical protein